MNSGTVNNRALPGYAAFLGILRDAYLPLLAASSAWQQTHMQSDTLELTLYRSHALYHEAIQFLHCL